MTILYYSAHGGKVFAVAEARDQEYEGALAEAGHKVKRLTVKAGDVATDPETGGPAIAHLYVVPDKDGKETLEVRPNA